MRLRIDTEVCTGHGRCYSLAPELFESDDYGHGRLIVDEVPAELSPRAELARANCPEQAISFET
jgi:ferredoxin